MKDSANPRTQASADSVAAARAVPGASGSPLPVDRVTLTADFEGVEESATALFRHLCAEGRVTRMARELDYHGEPGGDPELRSAADGLLYPVHAVLDYEHDGVRYCIAVKQAFDQRRLLVQINAPVAALEVAQRFLRFAGRPRAQVRRCGLSVETAVRLYEIIRQEGGARLLTQGRHECVRVKLDEQGRLIPESLRVEACLEGNSYVISMNCGALGSGGSFEVALECEAELHAKAAAILSGLVERAGQPPKEFRAGHVQSLRWEADVTGHDWSRLGGIGAVVARLREHIELPLRHPHAFERLDLRPTKGVLLTGPPGVGKTTLGKILACQSGAAFLAISPRDIASKWYGETEAHVGAIFAEAQQCARSGRGAILFVDEIDGFFVSRDGDLHEATRRALSQFMTEMDGLVALRGVVVLAATNRPQDLDSALLRPGRFDQEISIPMPDAAARAEIFAVYLGRKPCAPELDRRSLVRRTQGRVGAEIELWCNDAMLRAWKRHAAALAKDPATLSPGELSEVRLELQDFDGSRPRPASRRRSPRVGQRGRGRGRRAER